MYKLEEPIQSPRYEDIENSEDGLEPTLKIIKYTKNITNNNSNNKSIIIKNI